VGRTLDNNTKNRIVILEVKTDEIAQKIMENDPAIKNGIKFGQLFPYRIVLIRDL